MDFSSYRPMEKTPPLGISRQSEVSILFRIVPDNKPQGNIKNFCVYLCYKRPKETSSCGVRLSTTES